MGLYSYCFRTIHTQHIITLPPHPATSNEQRTTNQHKHNNEYKTHTPEIILEAPGSTTGHHYSLAILAGLGFLAVNFIGVIVSFIQTTIGLVITLVVLAAIIYAILDPKMRTLLWYMYKAPCVG